MFLNKEELQALTSYKYSRKQVNWLRSRGYKFEIAANGQPRVLRAYILNILGSTDTSKVRVRNKPDFDALVN